MKGGWALLLGCLLGLLPAPASEPPPLDSYRVRIFTEDHGLVTNNLTALAQTPDGYLWLGSYGGLARFDGVRFTMFTRENTPILPSNTIRSLFTDREGTLWIGAAGGLLRYDARGFQRVPLPEESPSERVLAIAQDSGGVLWFGTRNGVVVQDGGHLRRLAPEGPPLIVNALATTPGGQVWVGGDRGLFQVEGRGLRARTFPGLPPGEPINALALAPDGTLWAGTGRGLLQVDARGSHLITLRDGLPLPTVDRLFLEASGALWIASLNGGVARFWKGRFAFPPTPTLRIDHFEDMLADAEGSLWLPTYASGLVQLSSREVRSRGFRDGLLSEQIRCVVEDRRGSLWMGTNSQGLIEKRGDAYTVIGRKEGLGHPTVATLAEAPDGSLWAGTYLGGVYRVAQGRAHPVPELALTRKGSVRALLKDRLDRMWIGVDENLLLWDKGHVSRVGRGIGSPSAIYTLAEDREGTIWAGTFDGALLRIRQSQMEVLGPEIGLPGTAIFHLFPDPEGGIWIATFGGGLRWLREGRLMEVGLDRGLPPSQIFSLVLDPTGNLWGRTQDGLFTVPMKALRGAALGQPGPLPVRLLGRLDDVGASSGPSLSGAVLDRGGNLFFESVRGLVVRSPAPFPPEPPVPKVLVEHFRADGVDLPSGAEPLWGGGNLEFEYTAPSFLLPDKVQFRYQLEGFDPAWVEAGTRRKAFYTNVPPGTYTFRVRASNEAGVWNEGGATATFRLRPRFYQALWFTGLWIAAALALLLSLRFPAGLKRLPMPGEASREAGRAALFRGEVARGRLHLERAATQAPCDPETRMGLAHARFLSGDPPGAYAALAKAIADFPYESRPAFELAWGSLLLTEGRDLQASLDHLSYTVANETSGPRERAQALALTAACRRRMDGARMAP